MAQRSILNYFAKSPKVASPSLNSPKISSTGNTSPSSKNVKLTEESRKRKRSDSDSPVQRTPKTAKVTSTTATPKRTVEKSSTKKTFKRIRIEDSDEENYNESLKDLSFGSDEDLEDSGDEYKPAASEGESSEGEVSDGVVSESDDAGEESESSIAESPVKKRPPRSKPVASVSTPKTPSLNTSTIAKLSSFVPDKPFSDENRSPSKNTTSFRHHSFKFLKPEYIMDKNRRRPDNPDYDPSTLYVPDDFIAKETPGHQQWWNFKRNYYDTILFFKMGKFYELFHMDAVIGVEKLNILYMKGDYAHAGFPEKSYNRFVDIFLNQGYKVARIEQTETPDQLKERCKTQKKPDKVVSREICRITTPGTRTASHLDAEPASPQSSFLLAICEEPSSGESPEIGVCFIDTLIGTFFLGQFDDDRHYSRLRTLVTHHPPSELLLEKGKFSKKLVQSVEFCCPFVFKNQLRPKKEFLDADKTLKLIQDEYFKGSMPVDLVKMLEPSDSLQITPLNTYRLAIKSFGAVVHYLKVCLIDEELLSMKKFDIYEPCDVKSVDIDKIKNVVIDSVTLKNLEIFENTVGSDLGTLYKTIDHCRTKFGKRLLRSWLCSPLANVNLITERLEAVEDLMKLSKFDIENIDSLLSKLPDLERLLSKIHTRGCANRSKNHPDSRAILFDSHIYTRRKIVDFLGTLEGFKSCLEIRRCLESLNEDFSSPLLKRCAQYQPEGFFPEIEKVLKYFETSFDHGVAKKEGKIIPKTGVDADYDEAGVKLEKCLRALDAYKEEQSRFFGCKVNFVNSGKSRFMIEIPLTVERKANSSYQFCGQRKGFKRFYTDDIKRMLVDLVAAEGGKEKILQDIMRRIFEKFDTHYEKWISVVKTISLVDCLLSLAKYSKYLCSSGAEYCRPQFETSQSPFIKIKNSRHPCLMKLTERFVPNDLELDNHVLLLTGPNMGGKSTLMRQTGLITILAHIGCFVPAEECVLSPIDRIFTRLGAYDRIIEGESTLFVELNETSIILKNASKHSLVLLDELGRGTCTYDGTAIACSVVNELIENIQCRTIFSTHYHSLVGHFDNIGKVKMGHMACMIENENDEDISEESITFLYKLKSGSCPKSYGFNAAKLAGIPAAIVRSAYEKAKSYEKFVKGNEMIHELINNDCTTARLREIIKLLQETTLDL